MYFNPYAIPVLIAGIISLALFFFAWKHHKKPGAVWFILLMLSCSLYSIFYALEISSNSLPYALLFYKLEYLGASFLAAFLTFFAISITGKNKWLTPPVISLFLIIPVITLSLVITNEIHHFHSYDIHMETSGIFPVISFKPEPWYYLQQIYNILVIVYSIILFFRMWIKGFPVRRSQTNFLIAGAVIPFLLYVVYLAGWIPWGLDATPFGLTFTGIILFYGLIRHKLFDLTPLARTILFEKMPGGVIVIDNQHRITDYNQAVADFLGISRQVIGKPLMELKIPWINIINEEMIKNKKNYLETQYIADNRDSWLSIDLFSIREENQTLLGQIIVIHDITKRKAAEESLRSYQKRLSMLLSELNRTEERERSAIAGDLHDNVGQVLGIAKLKMNDLLKKSIPENCEKGVREIEGYINDAISQTRELISNLSPPSLQHIGLAPTIKWRLEQITESNQIETEVTEEGNPTPVDFDLQILIYRSVNELILNAIKHAHAKKTTVHLNFKRDSIVITVKDDGKGFDADHLEDWMLQTDKWGLFAIRERVRSLEGTMDIISRPGEGTEVRFELPLVVG